MTDSWISLALLPNVSVREPIEREFAALVAADDNRLYRPPSDRALAELLGRFTDPFCKKVQPSVLIVRDDAPAPMRGAEAIAGFRDAVALSVVCYQRALRTLNPGHLGILYSDSFSLYPWMLNPWMLSASGDQLTMLTPAGGASGARVADLNGQGSPDLWHANLAPSDVDQPLLEALLARWCERFRRSHRMPLEYSPVPVTQHGQPSSAHPGTAGGNELRYGAIDRALGQRVRDLGASKEE